MHQLNEVQLADAIAAKQLTRLEHAYDAAVQQMSGPQNGLVALALGVGVASMGGAPALVAASIALYYAFRTALCDMQARAEARRVSKIVKHPHVQSLMSKVAANAPASLASQNGTAWLIQEPKGTPGFQVLKKFEYQRHRRSLMSTGRMLDEVSISTDKIIHRRYIGKEGFTLATHKVRWSATRRRQARNWRPGTPLPDTALLNVDFAAVEADYRASRFLKGDGTGFKH